MNERNTVTHTMINIKYAHLSKADNTRHIDGATSHILLLVASMLHRGNRGATTNIEGANALWSVKFVCIEGHQIDVFTDRERNLSK